MPDSMILDHFASIAFVVLLTLENHGERPFIHDALKQSIYLKIKFFHFPSMQMIYQVFKKVFEESLYQILL